jgi:hypothetical protein
MCGWMSGEHDKSNWRMVEKLRKISYVFAFFQSQSNEKDRMDCPE